MNSSTQHWHSGAPHDAAPRRRLKAAAGLASIVCLGTTLLGGCSKVDASGTPGANQSTTPTSTGSTSTGSSTGSTANGTASAADSSASQTTGTATASGQGSATATGTAAANAPQVSLSAPSGITAMLPSDPIKVAVSNGTLKSVAVATTAGTPVDGALNGDTWKPTQNFAPATSYVANVTSSDANGTDVTQKLTFSTLRPGVVATYSIPYSGNQLGVGWPAVVRFDSAVGTAAMKAEVQRHVKITVTPAQEGAWGWLDDTQLIWRPKTYWKAGTKVQIEADLQGIQTGRNKWVGKNVTGGFTVGDSRVSYVNIQTHQMRVTKNGATVRTIPITAGRPTPSYTTRSGVKVITERLSQVIMDSETVAVPKNSPDSYRLMVYWAMRVTNTGEYLHAAPWSVASQGVANVSHGCTGMSTANAKWMFDFSRVGDVVDYTGSTRPFKRGEGMMVWDMSWDEWKNQSAL